MDKKPNPALTDYNVKQGTPTCGICTKSKIQYNLNTLSAQGIEAMILKGSDIFEKKTKAQKQEEKK